MGDATKKAALTKLAKMDVMVGYPDKFRDYSKLTMRPTICTATSSAARPSSGSIARDLNKPVDRRSGR